jgi:hypothetical protein
MHFYLKHRPCSLKHNHGNCVYMEEVGPLMYESTAEMLQELSVSFEWKDGLIVYCPACLYVAYLNK